MREQCVTIRGDLLFDLKAVFPYEERRFFFVKERGWQQT